MLRLGAAQVMLAVILVPVLLGALAVILALTAITASMSPLKASAVTPPSLVGESFAATSVTGSFTCSTGPTGSATFTASGPAIGPYPGTFVETGSATITPAFPLPTVTFNATFSITSPAGSVTGTKSFSGHFGSFDAANCLPVVEFAFILGTFGGPPITYHATINSPLGTVTDSGDADAQLCLCSRNTFSEHFTRSNGAVAVCNEDSQGNQNEQNDQIEDMNDQCGEGD